MTNTAHTYLLPIILLPLILFIITSLIYDHYQRGYLFTNRSINGTIFIEQALKRIPNCNENDSPRHEAILYTLQAWSQLAHLHDFRYWIAYKTLASYLYYHDLSPYDHDLDILIMAEDTPHLIEMMTANYSSIYKLKVHPQWFITKAANRSYFPSEGIDFTIQNARFIDQKNNVSINIWPMYLNYLHQNPLMLLQPLNADNWMLSPFEWTFPLEPCVFSGVKVWCPAQPKKLTASIFPQFPVYFSCTNGSWVHSN